MAEQNTRRHGPRGPHGGMAPGEKAKDFKGTMKKLMTYIGKYKFAVATVIVFAIGSTIFSIIGPKILSKATTELFNGLVAKIKGTGGIDFDKIGKILLILLIPFTRLIVGKSYGSTATIVPLVICAAPYIARVVESSLNEVDAGVIEAAKAMGASNMQIIFKVLLVEARTSLINGATITTGLLLGYSAMSGTVGGGGLGDIAVRYGYYRWQTDIMIVTVVLLIVIFQIIQNLGTRLSGRLDHRKR